MKISTVLTFKQFLNNLKESSGTYFELSGLSALNNKRKEPDFYLTEHKHKLS